MLVNDHHDGDVGEDQPLKDGSMTEERRHPPAGVGPADPEKIGREGPDFRGGPHDEPFDPSAREEGDPHCVVVDVEPHGRAREPLNASLEPRCVERVDHEESGAEEDREQRGEAPQKGPQPPPPRPAGRRLVAWAQDPPDTK